MTAQRAFFGSKEEIEMLLEGEIEGECKVCGMWAKGHYCQKCEDEIHERAEDYAAREAERIREGR